MFLAVGSAAQEALARFTALRSGLQAGI